MEKNGRITEKELTRYYKDIRRALLCRRRVKNKILDDFKCSVETYLENNPQADLSEITGRFGAPKKIAEDFAADRGIDYHRQLKRKRVMTVIIIGILAAIMIFTGVICALVIESHRHRAVYYDITLTDNGIITESGDK